MPAEAELLALTHNGRMPIVVNRAVPFYRAIMLELERRRLGIGLTMDAVSDRIGCADRYWSKAVWADRPSGRSARWETIQEMVDALFPEGVDVIIKPKSGERLGPDDLRRKIKFAAADHDRKTRRDLMRELGKRGAAARKLKLTKSQRKQIARTASKVAAIKRSKAAAARAQVGSTTSSP